MHYRFVLPADYDMGIIDRRIAEKARALRLWDSEPVVGHVSTVS